MEATGLLPPQPWMNWPETRQVMAAFDDAQVEARFVGGCIRDSILKRDVNDVDIATPAKPEQIIEILEAADIRAIPTGIEHGTITAAFDQRHFEITTLRQDLDTDGRRAKVAFIDDWVMDAARRDFTINAMSCDLAGNIYDPFEGLQDLAKGYIQFVGNAQKRIEEDLLRLLRFFRFIAIYGRYPINGDALSACTLLAPRLGELSGERVRSELFRILGARNTADCISKMRSERVLPHVLPEAGDIGRLRGLAWILEYAIKIDGLVDTPVRRLAAVLKPDLAPEHVSQLARRLKFSKREHQHLLGMMAESPEIPADISDQDLRLACHQVGASLVVDRALLGWAADVALEARLPRARTDAWIRVIHTARDWTDVPFPLRGQDVVDLGINHGPRVGELLKEVTRWWQDADFEPDREACLKTLRERANLS